MLQAHFLILVIFFAVAFIFSFINLSCINTEFNNPADPNVALLPPRQVVAETLADTAVLITWIGTDQARRYEIERQVGSGKFEFVSSVDKTQQSYIDRYNLIAGQTYTYRVCATVGMNRSPYASSSRIEFSFEAPSYITAIAKGDTAVFVGWTYSRKFQTGFEIERKIGTGNFQQIGLVPGAGRQFIDTIALIVGQTYTYRVRAISRNNKSEYTTSPQLAIAFVPPSQVNIVAQSDAAIQVSWICSGVHQAGFQIERRVGLGDFEPRGSVAASVTKFLDRTTLIVGENYTYRVRAFGKYNQSDYGTSPTFTVILDPPSNLKLISMTGTSVLLQWEDKSNIEMGFEIEQSINNPNKFFLIKTVGPNVTSATISGSFDETSTYYFRIRAKSFYNVSPYSNIVSNSVEGFIGLEMIFVQGGTFSMGSASGDSDEQPVHNVTLSSFYISKYEVTQALWKKVVAWKKNNGGTSLNSNPSYFSSDTLNPVEQVSWNDVMLWISHLNELLGTSVYRLPTEAEWEYAARGGVNWINNYAYSGSNTVDDVTWYWNNSGGQTHKVGTKQPNQLGIHDMCGNVWEWCSDWYSATYYRESPAMNPQGPSVGKYKVLRGGSYNNNAYNCRISDRYSIGPTYRDNSIGFRLVKIN